ncbi:cytoskeleton-associated protein 4 isoform X2 [Denticeps clupeoides]|nr:cytoskeleton-associated protein 4 isoform X2 [Denticeps clupeoides]
MTTKHRTKSTSSSSDKTPPPPPPPPQDDAARRSQKAVRPASGSGAKLLSALAYLCVAAAAGFASFYLQQVLAEVAQVRATCEQSERRAAQKEDVVLQQVDSLRGALVTAEGSGKAELQSLGAAVRKGERETQRLEEVLQKLQNEILRDLSQGILEVKEARERDFASLERTVEDRLAELSRSIAGSVKEFAEEQGEARSQLQELQKRVEERENPVLLKQELQAMGNAIAELHTANQVAEGNTGVLREQIASVGTELQTRNKEVASLSEEIESVRASVQSTAGALRQEVTSSLASLQGLSDKTQSLQSGQEQAAEAVESLEKELRGEMSKAEQRSDELEHRVQAVEERTESLLSSTGEQNGKLEAILSKSDSLESALVAQSQAAERARQTLQEELQGLQGSLVELRSSVASLGDTQSQVSSVSQQLEAVEKQVNALGDVEVMSGAVRDLQQLRGTVQDLVAKMALLDTEAEEHQRQDAAEEAEEEAAEEN